MNKLFLIILFLSACQNSDKTFSEKLNVWVGNPPQNLISSWGMPNNQTSVDENTQIYTYVLQSSSGSNTPYPEQFAYQAVESNNLGENPDMTPDYYCNISFVVNNGIISSYNFNGDNCLVDILPKD